MTDDASPPHVRPNKGFHPTLDAPLEQLFIDSCVQAWPDADFDQAHRHGVTAYAVTAWWPKTSLEQALERIMYWHLVARKHGNISVATHADDIVAAKRDGRAVFVLASQDGSCIGFDLARIEMFYRLGLRVLIPAYNASNQICGGCLDHDDGGLTRFGARVVEEANRIGLLLDGTHVGKRSSLDICHASDSPVVFSHSNAKRVQDNPRNIDDEQILACAATGGVVGMAPFGPFVLQPDEQEWPTLDAFLDHIDHVADLTGSVDHIGIGTDMSLGTYPYLDPDPWGPAEYPNPNPEYVRKITGDVRSPMRALRDFNSFAHAPQLIAKLNERGYDREAVAKILGENHLRVYREVWKPIDS